MNWVAVFLIISTAALVISFGLLAAVTVYLYKWHPRRLAGEVCPDCGYSRKGVETEHCSECGARWGSGARARTPAWVEVGLLAAFLLLILLVLPGVLMVGFGLFMS